MFFKNSTLRSIQLLVTCGRQGTIYDGVVVNADAANNDTGIFIYENIRIEEEKTTFISYF